ncbi:MAG: HD domain-containing protein [Candidatus Hydrothermarchaeales archaeon]
MSTKEFQEIRDPIHKEIILGETELELLDTFELQLLRKIRQLGLVYLIYPGAQHTRFEHTIGVFHVLKSIIKASRLNEPIEEEEMRLLRLAALLHDVGHSAFTHVIENQIKGTIRHEKMSLDLIRGRDTLDVDSDLTRVRDVIAGKDAKKIVRILNGEHYLSPLIDGPIDADKLDYLLRDSYYCGVNYGLYDDRIYSCFCLTSDKKIMLKDSEDSINSISTVLLSRYNLGKSVYKHHAVCAAEEMLSTAINLALDEDLYEEDLYTLGDEEVLIRLSNSKNPIVKNISKRLQYRKLYKRVYVIDGGYRTKTLLSKIDNINKSTLYKEEIYARLKKRAQKNAKKMGQEIQINNGDILVHLPKGLEPIPNFMVYNTKSKEKRLLHSIPDAATFLQSLEILYDRLWHFYVFVSNEESKAAVRKACEEEFDIPSTYGEEIPSFEVTPTNNVAEKIHLFLDEIESRKRVSIEPLKVLIKATNSLSRNDIAEKLGLSETTISYYLTAIKNIQEKNDIDILDYKTENREKFWEINKNHFHKLVSIMREKEYGAV